MLLLSLKKTFNKRIILLTMTVYQLLELQKPK